MIAPATSSSASPTTPSEPADVLSWEKQADLPDPIGWKGMYAGVSEGSVILAGGSNFSVPPRDGGRKVLSRQILMRPIHAAAGEEWTIAKETLPGGQAEGAAVSTDAGVVMLGGVGESGPVANVFLLRWDASLGTVQSRTLPPLPVPCASPAAVYWDGRIFVAGGEKDGRGLDNFWSLDIAAALAGEPTAIWIALPSWPGPARFGAVLAVLEVNGRENIFLLGGRVKATGAALADYLNDVHRYDPVAGRWTTLSAMPHRAMLPGCIRLGHSRLAILGGSDGHDLHRIAELGERYRLPDRIMVYNAHSDRWSNGGRMPLGVAAAAVVELGQEWLLAGGEYSPGLRTAGVYRAKPTVLAADAPVGTAHVYKRLGSRELKLHVVSPPEAKPTDRRPAIVFFHGGGWTGGSPAQFDSQSTYFASRGLVCVQVEYRLLDKTDQAPPLVCVQDAKSAMRWVRAHAAELGIDPARIGAAGGSAGGHLAAFAGMVGGGDDPADDLRISPRAAALVLFNPVLDNGAEGGWGQARVGARVKEFSPAHNVSTDDPPAIVFLGRDDKLVPVATIERFQAAMKSAGVRCDAFFYAGQGHGFFNKEPFMTRTLIAADKFLASLGWLEGAPTRTEPDPAGMVRQ